MSEETAETFDGAWNFVKRLSITFPSSSPSTSQISQLSLLQGHSVERETLRVELISRVTVANGTFSWEQCTAQRGLSDYIAKPEAEFFRPDQEVPAASAALSRRINFYFQLEVAAYSVWWKRRQWHLGVTIAEESNKTVSSRRLLHFRKEAAYLCFRFHRAPVGSVYVHRSRRRLYTFHRAAIVFPESDSSPL